MNEEASSSEFLTEVLEAAFYDDLPVPPEEVFKSEFSIEKLSRYLFCAIALQQFQKNGDVFSSLL